MEHSVWGEGNTQRKALQFQGSREGRQARPAQRGPSCVVGRGQSLGKDRGAVSTITCRPHSQLWVST